MTENPANCPKCGSPVTPAMKFCESCGAKIEALPACTKCGAALAPGLKFCENCGTPVGAAAPPAVTGEKPAPAPVPVKAEEKIVPEPVKPPVKTEEKPAPAPAAVRAEEKIAPEPVKPPVKTDEKPAPAPAVVKGTPAAAAQATGPKQPMSQTTMIIAGIVVLALLAAAAYFVVLPMLSGTGTPATPPATQTVSQGSGSPAVTSSGNTATAGTVSLVAGPTDSLPSDRTLIIDVERDAISRNIIVTFQGGNGQYGVRELVITLTRSDGTTETKTMSRLERGNSITLTGSDKENRVEITANFYNGETYKVVDKVFEYKKRMGTY
ncbi:zinc-ribbon domain-containing protein [Methanoregula sp. PtaB.Bin085]|uniref:zinc-ribbon domain-containing protein n=1 Tax=Methanoregula sp. PtaB.Bin085 TaxID=1811680 RepID=UPI0009C4FDAD|nr:zinc-ribbon domain-containing protein [Methanoregula sp. PtaB.Bin085]OPX63045.1 MAG: Double zinc ribbon [Methanoregula sp. PtaB.Bin085]